MNPLSDLPGRRLRLRQGAELLTAASSAYGMLQMAPVETASRTQGDGAEPDFFQGWHVPALSGSVFHALHYGAMLKEYS